MYVCMCVYACIGVCMYVCIRKFITHEFLQPKQSQVRDCHLSTVHASTAKTMRLRHGYYGTLTGNSTLEVEQTG